AGALAGPDARHTVLEVLPLEEVGAGDVLGGGPTLVGTRFFFFSSRRRHTRSVSAFLLNRSSDLNQAVATSQEAVQNQNEPQLRDENAHNDKSVHGVLNPTYQAGLRRDAVQPDIEAERKKRDEIEAGKSYCSRRFGGATCDDKSAQIYARFDKNDWRIQPAEFYRFHDAEVNTFGYF